MERFSCVTRFVFCYTINVKKHATFWDGIFLAANEVTDDLIHVLVVYVNSTTRFLQESSLELCEATERTFYFDFSQQKLYVNFGPDFNPLIDLVDYQYAIGFCDVKPVYIDAVSYLPVLDGAPTVKNKQDIIGGDKLAMTTGRFSMLNKSKDINFLKNLTLFSNDARVFFLDEDERDEYSRDELVEIAQMLIEDVDVSMKDGGITLQDLRKSFDVKMPIDLFTVENYPNADADLLNKPIPLCYGNCRAIPATCTNGAVTSGDVTFRAALEMTSLGTVQVQIDDVWTTVTPTSSDAARGLFTLSQADGRGGPDTDARQCRLLECEGKSIARLSDIIIDLDVKANGVVYNDTFYNTSEWEAEAELIVSGGYFIAEQKSLLEIIKDLQDGANRRFRFFVGGDGRRTMRVDDNDRSARMFVPKEKIKENHTFGIETDRSAVFAFINVDFDEDYSSGRSQRVVDASNENAVARNLRQRPSITYQTYLRTSAHALARAALEASMLGEVWRYASCTLIGKEFLDLQIYDILDIELFDDFDEWLGVYRAKVIATEPKNRENKVKLQLVERVPFEDENRTIRITSKGKIRIATKGGDDYWRNTK